MIKQPLKMSTFPTFHEYHHASPHKMLSNNNIHWVYRATLCAQCTEKGGNSYTMAKGNTIFTCLTHSFPKHYQIQLWGYTNPYLVHMRVSYCKHKNAYHSCVHELPPYSAQSWTLIPEHLYICTYELWLWLVLLPGRQQCSQAGAHWGMCPSN